MINLCMVVYYPIYDLHVSELNINLAEGQIKSFLNPFEMKSLCKKGLLEIGENEISAQKSWLHLFLEELSIDDALEESRVVRTNIIHTA